MKKNVTTTRIISLSGLNMRNLDLFQFILLLARSNNVRLRKYVDTVE